MKKQNLKTGENMAGFTVTRVEYIDELKTEATIFEHEKTGAKLLHLFNEDPNNLFCIAFRTPVYNNTGVPHILEHSVLSGSKKFPLKDPFKEMLKGSLQTFLNAITYPDKTMYPVSSQVEIDYYNLMDVYCDAVFNPLLTETTFAQEGWHLELDEIEKDISLKGIVYNEMKGVFSDFRSHVGRKTLSALYPDTTYSYESGGEPEFIPELSYQEFLEFHRKFYHPSNSFTVLYGDLPSEKTLEFLDKKYLTEFEKLEINSDIASQKIWNSPKKTEFSAPASKEEDGTSSVLTSWITGNSTDAVNALLGKVFSHYFFENDHSFMRKALVNSGLGEDLDDMCGFDGDLIQGMFSTGLRRVKNENSEKVSELIKETLKNEYKKGLDSELIEGAIRQIEFGLREITSGGYFPYNLMLAERAYRSWIYGGDPLIHLKFETPLSFIKEQKNNGIEFFNEKFREFFIDNAHTLITVVKASSKLGEELGNQSEIQTEKMTMNFTNEEKQDLVDATKKLKIAQLATPSKEIIEKLPKLDRKDLPLENDIVETDLKNYLGVDIYTHPIFSAGINYLDIGFNLTALPFDLIPYLPLYSELITRCGANGKNADEMARRTALSTGGISCSDSCSVKYGTDDELLFMLFFHGKSLEDHFVEMIEIFSDMLINPDFDDLKLLKDIITEMRNDLNSSIVRSGHSYASRNSASRLLLSKFIEEQTDGIAQLRLLDKILKNGIIKDTLSKIKQVHKYVINIENITISLTGQNLDNRLEELKPLLDNMPTNKLKYLSYPFQISESKNAVGVEISSSVNYIAESRLLKSLSPKDSGLNFLISRNLSTGYLWDKIRVEGGAYGGMANTSPLNPLFTCVSYRDPNIVSTIDHFSKGLTQIKNGLNESEVDQSVIGAIGKLDAPKSPHSKGYGETLSIISNRPKEVRQDVRNAILNSNSTALSNQADKIMKSENSSVTVFASSDALEKAKEDKLDIMNEPLL